MVFAWFCIFVRKRNIRKTQAFRKPGKTEIAFVLSKYEIIMLCFVFSMQPAKCGACVRRSAHGVAPVQANSLQANSRLWSLRQTCSIVAHSLHTIMVSGLRHGNLDFRFRHPETVPLELVRPVPGDFLVKELEENITPPPQFAAVAHHLHKRVCVSPMELHCLCIVRQAVRFILRWSALDEWS